MSAMSKRGQAGGSPPLVPGERAVITSIKLPAALLERARAEASRRGIYLAALVREALERELKVEPNFQD